MARPIDRIRLADKSDKSSYTYYPVVVIGAGESGICMGARLQQVLGFNQFRIFERRGQLGGTWYTNTYPGIACDVWTAPYPAGSEIREYLHNVVRRFKLTDKIQCDTNVKSMHWVESDQEWQLELEHLAPGVGDMATAERQALERESGNDTTVLRTEIVRAKIVASAVGGLVEPKPRVTVPGIESFQGEIFHTARWNSDADLRNKDVVVVGTGCSGAQVMASLVKPEYGVKSVTQLLRSPPWVVPAMPKDSFEFLKTAFTYIPGSQNLFRKLAFGLVEYDFINHFPDTPRAKKGRQASAQRLLRYMRKRVPEQYHDIMTPNYEVFCKRRVIDDGWFASLQDSRAEITSQPLTAIGNKTVTVGPGRHYPPLDQPAPHARTDIRELPCDVLIMANGFATHEYLHPLDITGRHGQTLHGTWKDRGGAQAYLGVAMDGFPNFFIIFGPNTATGHSSVILATENMVNYSLKFIAPVLRGEIATCEVREDAERKWTQDLQAALKNCVFASGGCRNWYVEESSGWNSTVYPWTQIHHTLRCMFPRWRDWNVVYTRKGLLMLWARRVLRTLVFVSAIVAAGYVRRNGWSVAKEKVFEMVGLAKSFFVRA